MKFLWTKNKSVTQPSEYPWPELPETILLIGGNSWSIPQRVPVIEVLDNLLSVDAATMNESSTLFDGEEVDVCWQDRRGWHRNKAKVCKQIDGLIWLERLGLANHWEERRTKERKKINSHLHLRAQGTKVLRAGERFQALGIDIDEKAIKFLCSKALAPGDTLMMDYLDTHFKLRVLRMEGVTGTWRQQYIAAFEELSDWEQRKLNLFLAE